MKTFLVIVVLLVLLGGGGVAGWIYYNNRMSHAAEAGAEPAPVDPPVYVDFRPLQLPVISGDRVEQRVTIKLVLEAANRDAADRLIAMAPRLTDAYMLELYGKLDGRSVIRADGLLDLAQVKARILQASRRVMGEGVVTDALVQTVAQRRM